ncbi:MAG TPA: TetR/AcrR family transcriptional regulator [Polyangiaceae bacterium]|nr:TetR/AcrR family transcriptional regulator [Polyangiaceae bacterium]
MTSAELSKIEQKKADKRRRLLEAALELFAERGFHGTAVPLVAERAGISAGSVYRFFESKEALVNAVFRDAKTRLASALSDLQLDEDPKRTFDDLCARLVRFAREDPTAFHFLELQDHAPYLDDESRALEMQVLTPIAAACAELQRRGTFRADVPMDVVLACIWGAFVGLFKAERHGYLSLDEARVHQARDACFNAFAAR